jgi:hypothetical protein
MQKGKVSGRFCSFQQERECRGERQHKEKGIKRKIQVKVIFCAVS